MKWPYISRRNAIPAVFDATPRMYAHGEDEQRARLEKKVQARRQRRTKMKNRNTLVEMVDERNKTKGTPNLKQIDDVYAARFDEKQENISQVHSSLPVDRAEMQKARTNRSTNGGMHNSASEFALCEIPSFENVLWASE